MRVKINHSPVIITIDSYYYKQQNRQIGPLFVFIDSYLLTPKFKLCMFQILEGSDFSVIVLLCLYTVFVYSQEGKTGPLMMEQLIHVISMEKKCMLKVRNSVFERKRIHMCVCKQQFLGIFVFLCGMGETLHFSRVGRSVKDHTKIHFSLYVLCFIIFYICISYSVSSSAFRHYFDFR